ncbi:hypothetical protein H4W31_008223 [Plantactinospora soyae]|uniref:Uncharacterized protein n=1 Tax=Plantactinospora soyae TaxID=1544732 RepID=A0A927R1C9_9ACTN|nr:hypothetical protein [Plantactinospora soyae]
MALDPYAGIPVNDYPPALASQAADRGVEPSKRETGGAPL